jgi:hypothetical protein
MLPTKDQLRLKAHSKAKKSARAVPLKIVAECVGMIPFIALPLAFLFNPIVLVVAPIALAGRWLLLIAAARVYGPHLGEDPGRAHKATLEDARRGRLT